MAAISRAGHLYAEGRLKRYPQILLESQRHKVRCLARWMDER